MANPKRKTSAASLAALSPASPKAGLRTWLTGARIRTLPLALAPIFAAAGLANLTDDFNSLLVVLCALVALALQVGVNYANDYSDGVRGTDDNRVGPARLTGGGLARPAAVKRAAIISFAVAGLAGLVAVLVSAQYWLIGVGAIAIVAAWYYTGGKRPYGYAGWGEVAVFVFFGLVATLGTLAIQGGLVDELAWLVASSVGSYASAVLLVNNIRDIETDRVANKRTLAVLLGRPLSKVLFLLMIWVPILLFAVLSLVIPAMLFGWLNLLLLIPITVIFLLAKTPRDLITVLKLTSFAGLANGLLLGLAFIIINPGLVA